MKQAHVHLLSALWAEFNAVLPPPCGDGEPIRILDIGCGYGGLMIDLTNWAGGPAKSACPSIEVFGYEVFDHRASSSGYRQQALENLARAHPNEPWEQRLRLGGAREPWPFDSACFDFAVSNQVIEHVADLPWFWSELRRVMRPNGRAVHYFPVREILIEPHCGVPLAHRFRSPDAQAQWIRFCSRLHLGKFPQYRRERGATFASFSAEFVAYLARYTFFRSSRSVAAQARAASASADYRYESRQLLRFLNDDWDLYPYRHQSRDCSKSLLAPFAPSTLIQTF